MSVILVFDVLLSLMSSCMDVVIVVIESLYLRCILFFLDPGCVMSHRSLPDVAVQKQRDACIHKHQKAQLNAKIANNHV